MVHRGQHKGGIFSRTQSELVTSVSFISYIFTLVDSNPVTNEEASIDVLVDTCKH